MSNNYNFESQVEKLIKEASTTALTKDDFILNVILTSEKAIAAMTQIKNLIKKKKDRININELLIIGAEFEYLSMEIDAIRREHHL